MTSDNNLDALFADAELPFGHPGRRFDDTPEYFDRSPLVDQGPERDYTPDEDEGPRSLAGKPLAGFCATRCRRIQVLYGIVVYVIRCNIHYVIDKRR